MKKKILIVDDEKDIVEFMSYNLRNEGFEVIEAFDGIEALEKMKDNPHLVVLDVMMPKMDGYETCKRIRKMEGFENVPVIFLTAKSSEIDEVHGLNIGAADFVQKPVSTKKIIARIKANLRKSSAPAQSKKADNPSNKIVSGPLVIDRDRFTIHLEGGLIVLPKKEFEILSYFAQNPGIVFSRDQILKDVWGDGVFVVDRTIDVHVRKIREKLGIHSNLIETVKGVGYRFASGG
ncbi:MAG: response regulator transcription factor [Bacteroidetes bacterium]|nr:response regulator transcription factor [Bacteroidota bacterium]MBU2506096.1 response regulator transcription factor [Bacteroidota bacterium]